MIKLTILLPTEVYLNADAALVIAEGLNGSFCLKPKHADFVTATVPGIFQYEDKNGERQFLGLDSGVLIKAGENVNVSTLRALRGGSLETLADDIKTHFEMQSEQEKRARAAYHALESSIIRRFLEMG